MFGEKQPFEQVIRLFGALFTGGIGTLRRFETAHLKTMNFICCFLWICIPFSLFYKYRLLGNCTRYSLPNSL